MIGKRVSGRYKLLEVIGDGGMAIVYRAKDLILDRDVAVKVLRSEFNKDEDFIRRFKREAESATSLDHPNIVSIYDVGEDEEIYFIVMEYVQGKTLKQYIKEHGKISVEESLHIMKQIVSGMAVAHEHGIIHRDIKPHNILITEDGTAKLTDFGIALAITSATITHTNSILGSVHYFSPEQARGGIANAKSDIYSFGAVLYEMVTGRVPFVGESPVSVALKHLQENVIEPRRLNSEIPQSVENIILKSLAKNPLKRYDSAQELLTDMNSALSPDRMFEQKWTEDSDEDEKTKFIPPVVPPPIEEKLVKEEEEKAPKKKKKKWWLILLISLLLLGGAAVAAFTIWSSVFSVQEVNVPDVVGDTYEDAFDKLKAKNLNVKREEVFDPEIEDGHVIRQNPSSGTVVKEHAVIVLHVSKGPEKENMPDVEGYNIESAQTLLKDKGFTDININYEESDTEPEGTVLTQSPDRDEKVTPAETTVTLTVSSGTPTVQISNLIGLTEQDVKTYSENEGLIAEFTSEYSDTVEKGKVISQNPAPFTQVEKGATISVVLSDGPDPNKEKEEEAPPPEPEKPAGDRTTTKKIEVRLGKKERNEPAHVRIVYSDKNAKDKVFVEEEISETKEYALPLTIAEGGTASYVVYINDKEEKKETIKYDDIKEGDDGD
ncbi:Stk1 family PASTA domain-containing Ser/Thr kinase [Fictibacillus phosphorivorans]|uniref:Stk1 family PASTA domain-containing Ser/Thr kinase n=1 Tax=Fictibacillus phosphorivorans TaxID=1221500 RepID=UPI00203FEF14|nr:Stk1 family PASTA domain-containing Ser/Thr kinase [Fictibacillus phosphorivorans]MCM3717208.1 Stk1 family PASTA domain-containing Ser/Thr kinase [Fictibacillus phosphorivorans]MCM3774895.1 Stk1 family PASTA domain-containing Ser/Thr kinase [Fictibacillus phosphorivorans]